jgi:hypothetical protein
MCVAVRLYCRYFYFVFFECCCYVLLFQIKIGESVKVGRRGSDVALNKLLDHVLTLELSMFISLAHENLTPSDMSKMVLR